MENTCKIFKSTIFTLVCCYFDGRGYHRGNLARQGICLGWQGTSFPLDPLTPCTNPRLPTKIATSPNFNGHLRTKLGNSGPKGHLEWRSISATKRQNGLSLHLAKMRYRALKFLVHFSTFLHTKMPQSQSKVVTQKG